MPYDYNQAIPVSRIGGSIYSFEKTHGYWLKEGNVSTNPTQLLSLMGTNVTGDHGEQKGSYFETSIGKGLFESNNWFKPIDLDV